jgi:hypothetical protein
MRGSALPALVVTSLVVTGAFGQCRLPPAPGQATPDSNFNALVTQQGPGWTGGDGTYSVQLPNGDDLWIWSDSYIGTVNPETRRRAGWLLTAHNSLFIQTPGAKTITTIGYPPQTTSYFVPPNPNNWFWPGDAKVVEVSPGVYKVVVMLLEWTGNYSFQGTSVAVLSYPSMSIDFIKPVALPDLNIEWGTQLLRVGSWLYIYGIQDPGTWQKLPYVARMSSVVDLANPSKWEYWNGTTASWVTGDASATPLSGVPAITNEYSVSEFQSSVGTFYMMTGMETWSPGYPDWKNVVTYYSCAPQGPWSNRTIVYVTPESGQPGCTQQGNLLTYNPKAHPEFTDSRGVLVSYNVNASVGKDLVCANDYVPRFVRVPIPGLTANDKTNDASDHGR